MLLLPATRGFEVSWVFLGLSVLYLNNHFSLLCFQDLFMVSTDSNGSKLRTFQGPFWQQFSNDKSFYAEFHNIDISKIDHIPTSKQGKSGGFHSCNLPSDLVWPV